MASEIQIESFTVTSLVVTAAMCVAALLVAWYTVRDRIHLSQIILGVFSYILVMLLENVLDLMSVNLGLPQEGLAYGVYMALSVVVARELVRFVAMRYGVRGNFNNTDAAIGFALGFAGVYLGVCAAYYFNCYTVASEFTKSGLETFLANAGTDSEEALSLLEQIAAQNGWQFVFTGVNRVFYLVREIALSVLLWYALADDGKRWYLALVPLLHLAAMVPDALFQAGLMESSYVRDVLTCLISGGIAFVAARQYNAREDQVSHFKVERLRARRRK